MLRAGIFCDRIATNGEVTIRHVLDYCEDSGRIRNFERAAEPNPGPYCSDYPYDDSDVYKCIEGAARTLSLAYDEALDRYLNDLIETIARAQDEDGYLYPFAKFEFVEDEKGRPRDWWYGPERWDKVHLHSHELYNVGHLYEAAVAHFEATGKRSLLDVALKNANLIVATFGHRPGQIKSIPGHQEIELGLVKLFLTTGEKKYLNLAGFFLAGRGNPEFGLEGGEYWQNHIPVKEQREAVGHAVRAAYMYSSMADIGVLTEDQEYIVALDSIWQDVVETKLYLTGGIGAAGENEGFRGAFQLANASAYCETCAAIANVMWNHRMFLIHGDAKYIDVMERALYNNVLSGISLDGTVFFYPNPLESAGEHQRTPWFSCACCPTNVVRFLPQIPGLAYATNDSSLFVNLFLDSTTSVTISGVPISVDQTTEYPWHGLSRIVIEPERPLDFSVRVRLPGWSQNRPVPGRLYRYMGEPQSQPTLRLNGELVPGDIEKSYIVITRTWNTGDVIEVDLPMDVRIVAADERIKANRGRIALERGPVVFAAEGIDNHLDVRNLRLDPGAHYDATWESELLHGITSIRSTALNNGTEVPFMAIPYYAWAHRGKSTMAVWFKTA